MPKKTITSSGEKHYHTYERMKSRSGRKDMYRCKHPECNHFAPASLIEGKTARCFYCQGLYQLTPYALRLKTPHCGCRSLSEFQRVKLRQLSAEQVDQTVLAVTILKALGEKDESS